MLPRLLFWLVCAAAAALLGLLLLAPLLAGRAGGAAGRLLGLFARDAALRRTALASALGLLTTACVFFRGPPAPPAGPRRPRPPAGGVGA